jgi:hypothetical protein
VGIAPPEAAAGPVGGRRGIRESVARHPGPLVFFGYLVAAVAVNWRLWAGRGTMSPTGDPGPADNDLMAWFVRYAADAVAHGHLPALVTTALNAPHGINLMWNNTVLLPGVVLTPVTLLGGPQASLTVVATLGLAGSAAAMYWLLRRHGASAAAGGLGGAVFGFSPGMVNASNAHYGMEFAVLVPLMAEATVSIVTGRGRPLRTGAWLGLLAAAQLFTGEELLSDTAIGCLLVVAVLAVSRPRAAMARLGGSVLGLGTAAVVALLLSGYGLWVQFHGPLVQHGDPWQISEYGNSLGAFVNPQAGLVFHTAASAAYAAGHRASSSEYVAYLGPPLLILVAGITIGYWRDLRVRAAGISWLVLEALSLGVSEPWLPFHWLQHLPLLSDMFPSRMALLADGGAAAVLAFGLDLARYSAPRTAGLLRRTGPTVVALLAVLPLVPRPVPAITAAPVPAGWDAVFTRLRLPADASVLVAPLPYSQQGEAMLWQADTGQPGELVAGWFLGPNASGHADVGYWGPPFAAGTVRCLGALWRGSATSGDCAAFLRSALGYWHPAAVVADTSPGTPLGRFLVKSLGKPALRDGQLLAWRTV